MYVSAPAHGTTKYTAYFESGVGIGAANATTNNFALRSTTVHLGDGFDATAYGQLQITRPAVNGTAFHQSFIRSGSAVFGMGFLSSSTTFGMQASASGNNTGSTGIFIDSAGLVGVGTRIPAADRALTATPYSTTGSSFCGDTQNASYTGSLVLLNTSRVASSAFGYLQAYSNNVGDLEFHLRGDGNGFCDGSWSGGGADYAEYFESATGAPIPNGTTVYLDGDKVRACTPDQPMDPSLILGVVRPKGMAKSSIVVGNAAWNAWQGKFLTDEFGVYLMEDHNVIEWTDVSDESEKKHSYEDWNIPAGVIVPPTAVIRTHDEKGRKHQHRKLNPLFDPTTAYTPREQRDEWILVGLLGQVPIRDDQRVHPNWIKLRSVSTSVSLWMVR